MTDQEFYWLAGLLEGEGSFSAGPPSAPNSVRIMLTMTDEDVVARVAALWGIAYHQVRKERCQEMGWKPNFFVHLRGKPAVALMQQLLPLMGERRQGQIKRTLASYDPYFRRKLTPDKISEIKAKLADGYKHHEIAKQYGVARSTITHINTGSKLA